MSGSTLNVRAVQSLRKLIKKWGMTSAGLLLMPIIIIAAIGTMYVPWGYGQQPTLQPSDISQLSQKPEQAPTVTVEEKKPAPITKPQRILMPSINLGLDVIDSTITIPTNEWPLSDTNAHYANFTPGLGSEKGTLLLYGHATQAVLGETHNLTIGDPLVLIDSENKIWQFTLQREELVSPAQVSFIYEDTPFRVVVFTCYGWNNEYRNLMYFTPTPTIVKDQEEQPAL